MDRALINELSEAIHENNIVYKIYKNKNGKAQWNVICSAIDWIKVVIDQIDPNKVLLDNSNAASVQLMTFIMCIDVLWESIQQLHRVLYETAKAPFHDERKVFSKKIINLPDNQYFKTIRACFAAHPVNLQDDFGKTGGGDRWYADWSLSISKGKDYSVQLRSNNPMLESVWLTVSTKELMEFAQKRYQHLKKLIDRIKTIKQGYIGEWKSIIIATPYCTLDQISVLMEENQLRFDDDHYHYLLQQMRTIFSVNPKSKKNRSVLEGFQEALLIEIEEIRVHLQKMELGQLENNVLDKIPIPADCEYSFSELTSEVFCNASLPLWSQEPFRNHLDKVIDFKAVESVEELFALVLSGFYKMSRISADIQPEDGSLID